MTVTATIDGRPCGQGPTLAIDGQIVYKAHVLADGAAAGCGAAGRTITFKIGERALSPTALWDNSRVWHLDLAAAASDLNRWFVYLPMAQR
jgi:hypothetical protein